MPICRLWMSPLLPAALRGSRRCVSNLVPALVLRPGRCSRASSGRGSTNRTRRPGRRGCAAPSTRATTSRSWWSGASWTSPTRTRCTASSRRGPRKVSPVPPTHTHVSHHTSESLWWTSVWSDQSWKFCDKGHKLLRVLINSLKSQTSKPQFEVNMSSPQEELLTGGQSFTVCLSGPRQEDSPLSLFSYRRTVL